MTGGALATRSAVIGSRRHRAWLGLFVLEGLALAGYFAVAPGTTGPVRYLVYPLVWINAGLWAAVRTEPTPGSRGHRLVGVAAAVAYFLLVMVVPGKLGFGPVIAPVDLRVAWYAPGWGPLVALSGPVRLYLVPFEVVGYASLSYLVYANALDASRGVLSGALGLVTCVGCTVPVLVPVVGLLGGPAAGLATTAYRVSYDLGTAVFLVTLGLLYAAHRRSSAGR